MICLGGSTNLVPECLAFDNPVPRLVDKFNEMVRQGFGLDELVQLLFADDYVGVLAELVRELSGHGVPHSVAVAMLLDFVNSTGTFRVTLSRKAAKAVRQAMENCAPASLERARECLMRRQAERPEELAPAGRARLDLPAFLRRQAD